jgi:hypothetical protein
VTTIANERDRKREGESDESCSANSGWCVFFIFISDRLGDAFLHKDPSTGKEAQVDEAVLAYEEALA